MDQGALTRRPAGQRCRRGQPRQGSDGSTGRPSGTSQRKTLISPERQALAGFLAGYADLTSERVRWTCASSLPVCPPVPAALRRAGPILSASAGTWKPRAGRATVARRLPCLLVSRPYPPAGVAGWLMRVTPAAAFAAQQTLVPYARSAASISRRTAIIRCHHGPASPCSAGTPCSLWGHSPHTR